MQDWQMDWQHEEPEDDGQLELPGIALDRSDELLESLGELEQRLEQVRLTAEEVELLRRFRRSDANNRRMVMRLLAG
ncbi:hypothetical protein BY454_10468 [Marinobacter persicus]|jgi:hypothetical protein|uniref:Uncharacterized protein n=2 Tax=Marinobacter persicus TaxID=930118 RepID=A0A2S6G8Z0_9GAMM|nr:MAG: hypothetical protein AWU57_4482 [Marinobacter sp. T13-3]PPK52751.1 hypothetical protein BY455_10468 [Marinobacter persicus]PPK55703.1 hypothetical protein B0H24_1004107 [Marinobacter persicus]PPK59262.1 hypothetical protein BY454_10468 [Marinobacter persicus]